MYLPLRASLTLFFTTLSTYDTLYAVYAASRAGAARRIPYRLPPPPTPRAGWASDGLHSALLPNARFPCLAHRLTYMALRGAHHLSRTHARTLYLLRA